MIHKASRSVSVRFRRGIPAAVREAVLEDVQQHIDELENETAYHLASDEVQYWVERWGDDYFVDDADWRRDVYEIEVA